MNNGLTMRRLASVGLLAVVILMGAVSVCHAQGMGGRPDGTHRGFDNADRNQPIGERDQSSRPYYRPYPYRYYYPSYGYSGSTYYYYYYCPGADAYYPYVTSCPDAWVLIPAW